MSYGKNKQKLYPKKTETRPNKPNLAMRSDSGSGIPGSQNKNGGFCISTSGGTALEVRGGDQPKEKGQ